MKAFLLTLFIGLSLSACGDHGHITFTSERPPNPVQDRRPAGFNVVLGSQALVKSTSGYSAKIQLAEMSGIKSTSTSGYSAKIRFTTRHP